MASSRLSRVPATAAAAAAAAAAPAIARQPSRVPVQQRPATAVAAARPVVATKQAPIVHQTPQEMDDAEDDAASGSEYDEDDEQPDDFDPGLLLAQPQPVAPPQPQPVQRQPYSGKLPQELRKFQAEEKRKAELAAARRKEAAAAKRVSHEDLLADTNLQPLPLSGEHDEADIARTLSGPPVPLPSILEEHEEVIDSSATLPEKSAGTKRAAPAHEFPDAGTAGAAANDAAASAAVDATADAAASKSKRSSRPSQPSLAATASSIGKYLLGATQSAEALARMSQKMRHQADVILQMYRTLGHTPSAEEWNTMLRFQHDAYLLDLASEQRKDAQAQPQPHVE